MSDWLEAVTAAQLAADIEAVVDAVCKKFNDMYKGVADQIDEKKLRGQKIIDVAARVPGLADYVYGQWQTLVAISQVLDLRIQSATQRARKHYLESYNRELSPSQVENYAKADPAVLRLMEMRIRVNLVEAHWAGFSKGLDKLNYNVKMTSDLRREGMEEAVI